MVVAVQSLELVLEPFLILGKAGAKIGHIVVDADEALGDTLLC